MGRTMKEIEIEGKRERNVFDEIKVKTSEEENGKGE